MHQFDDYINRILKDLKISKKKKAEMAEEFLDHLQMLKREYLAKGMTENEATKQAMITFGEENGLKRKLSESLLKYKSFHNIIGGIFILLYCFIITHIRTKVYDANYSGIPISTILLFSFVPNNLIFISLGYYLPIFFEKMEEVQNIILVSIVTGIIWSTFLLFIFPTPWNGMELQMKLILLVSPLSIISNIIEFMFGFTLLQLFNRTSTVYKKLVLKHSN